MLSLSLCVVSLVAYIYFSRKAHKEWVDCFDLKQAELDLAHNKYRHLVTKYCELEHDYNELKTKFRIMLNGKDV